MTVTTEISEKVYAGNGSTTAFPSGFLVQQSADLRVTLKEISSGAETVLVEGTHYSVADYGAASGVTVTYPISGSPMASTHKLILERIVSYVQTSSITNQSGFYPAVIELIADRGVMMLQQIKSLVSRAPFFAVDTAVTNFKLPEPVAGYALGWNATGDGFSNLASTGTVTVSPVMEVVIGKATTPEALTALGLTSFGQSLVDDADAEAARTTLGVGNIATLTSADDLNSLSEDGVYAWVAASVPTNAPSAEGMVIHRTVGTSAMQLSLCYTLVYSRYNVGGGFSGWIYHASTDIDGTLAGNSDTVVPSEKAVKTYVDTNIAANGITQTSGDAPYYGTRAWAAFVGSSGSVSANGNVASVTRNGTGDYSVAFTDDMPHANYAVIVSCDEADFGIANVTARTVSGFDMIIGSRGSTNVDPDNCFFAVHA